MLIRLDEVSTFKQALFRAVKQFLHSIQSIKVTGTKSTENPNHLLFIAHCATLLRDLSFKSFFLGVIFGEIRYIVYAILSK